MINLSLMEKKQKLTECIFTKDGYTFAGWSTSKDGTVTIADESDGSTLTTTDGDTFTLYAVWKENTTSDTESIEESIALTSLDDIDSINEVEQTEN